MGLFDMLKKRKIEEKCDESFHKELTTEQLSNGSMSVLSNSDEIELTDDELSQIGGGNLKADWELKVGYHVDESLKFTNPKEYMKQKDEFQKRVTNYMKFEEAMNKEIEKRNQEFDDTMTPGRKR